MKYDQLWTDLLKGHILLLHLFNLVENIPLCGLLWIFFYRFLLGLIKLSLKWSESILLNTYLNCGTYLYHLYIKKVFILFRRKMLSCLCLAFLEFIGWFFHKISVIFSLMYQSLLNFTVVIVCRGKDYLARDRIFKSPPQRYSAVTAIKRKTTSCLSWIIKLAEWASLIVRVLPLTRVCIGHSFFHNSCLAALLQKSVLCFVFVLSKRCICYCVVNDFLWDCGFPWKSYS